MAVEKDRSFRLTLHNSGFRSDQGNYHPISIIMVRRTESKCSGEQWARLYEYWAFPLKYEKYWRRSQGKLKALHMD